jgi:hypothetical protein
LPQENGYLFVENLEATSIHFFLMATLQSILQDSAATLDLSTSLPTGDELTLRENYANQAVEDAAATGQFPEFKKEFEFLCTTTAVPLPSGFREFHVNPQGLASGGWHEFGEIRMEEKYGNSSDYVYVTGNPQSGYVANFSANACGMSMSAIYQSYPVGMLSLSAICELSDPTYVTRKIESYVLYSRGDDRFQTAESRANNVLLNMTGRKMKGAGGQGQTTRAGFANPLS